MLVCSFLIETVVTVVQCNILGGDSGFVPLSGQHPDARGHLSEALTEDTGVGNSVAGSPLPLTTGNENLDVAIVIHLQYCNHLIQVEPPSDVTAANRAICKFIYLFKHAFSVWCIGRC